MTGQRGSHRSASPHRLEPNRWLGAGAITLGIGAILAGGAGVAHADNGSGPAAHPHRDNHCCARPHASPATPATSATDRDGPSEHQHPKSGNHTATAPAERPVTALASGEATTPAVATAAVRVVAVAADASGGRLPSGPHARVSDIALAAAARRTTHNSVSPVAAQYRSGLSHDTVTPAAPAAVPMAATPSTSAASVITTVATQVGNFVANAITGTIKMITGTVKAVVNQVWYLGLSLEAAVLNIFLGNSSGAWVVIHDSSGYYLEWKFNTWTI